MYVTNFGPNQLYRNRGDGSFERVTESAGVGDPGWGSSATFVDYDADGRLDLFVVNYLELDEAVECYDAAGRPSYCDVGRFAGQADRLYRNEGDGTFSDATAAAGIGGLPLHGLGVIAADLSGDGRVDLYVANDMDANQLWVNQGDGTFVDRAVLAGAAYNRAGHTEAGMGVVSADVDNDGDLDLFSTHFHGESHTLYDNLGEGRFEDVTAEWGLVSPSMPHTGFGAAAIDVEHDGDLDLLVANGHVYRVAPEPGSRVASFWADYAQRGAFFRNEGGHFVDASADAGDFGADPRVGRGLALGDLDGDGDLDFVTSSCGDRARVFMNETPRSGHWLSVRVVEGAAGRDSIGARVTVTAGDRRWTRLANPGFSYLSSSDPRAHFGLGTASSFDGVEVVWPDGTRERFPGGEADRALTLVRGSGT